MPLPVGLRPRATAQLRVSALGWIGRRSGQQRTFGNDTYTRRTAVGVLDLDLEDGTQSWRVEAARPVVRTWTGVSGATARHARPSPGACPWLVAISVASLVMGRSTSTRADWYGGTYLEATTIRHRLDDDRSARRSLWPTRDHRRSASERARRSRPLARIRYATGIYHQAPAASYYDSVRGATASPMRAVHHIIGYETGTRSRWSVSARRRLQQGIAIFPSKTLPSIQQRRHRLVAGIDLFVQRCSAVSIFVGCQLAQRKTTMDAGGSAKPIRACPMERGGPTSRSPGRCNWWPPCRSVGGVAFRWLLAHYRRTTAHASWCPSDW